MKEQVKIGGKKRSLEFNFLAIKTYEKVTEENYLSVADAISTGTTKSASIMGLAYAGLVGAGEDVEIDDVAKWVLKMTQEQLTEMVLIFLNSFPERETDSDEPAGESSATPGE